MNEGLFKKAFRGFKKADVLQFIDELDATHRKKEQEQNQKIEQLTAELREKNDLGAKAEIELQQAAAETEAAKSRNVGLEEELQGARGDMEELQSRLDSREAEIDGLRKELLLAQQRLKAANEEGYQKERRIGELETELSGLQTAVQRMNKTEDQIGRVMLEARSMADKMVEDARRGSEQMLVTAGDRVRMLAGSVGDFKGRVEGLHGTTKEFFEISQRLLEQIERAAESIETEFVKMAEDGLKQQPETDVAEGCDGLKGSGVQGDAPFRGAAEAEPDARYDEEDGGYAAVSGEQP